MTWNWKAASWIWLSFSRYLTSRRAALTLSPHSFGVNAYYMYMKATYTKKLIFVSVMATSFLLAACGEQADVGQVKAPVADTVRAKAVANDSGTCLDITHLVYPIGGHASLTLRLPSRRPGTYLCRFVKRV